MAHAILSPSSASRWLNCTPSARLEEKFPDTTSEAAAEGTHAHTLGELLIQQKLGWVTKPNFKKRMIVIEANKFYDTAMLDHAESYATFVLERFSDGQSRTADAQLFLEQKLNLTEYVPEGFGTGDAIIIADGILDIVDLKYGKGVPVSALENRQMMLYSLGALREFDYMYDIQTVRMTIFQPRLDTVSTWEMSVADLKKWAETELKPRAAMAFKGEGQFVSGKHCQFCKIRATCKAHAEMNLQVAAYDFKEPVFLSDDEIADIMDRAAAFKSWLSAVEDHALFEAITNNKHWPGYKLVEGRSNRQYTDETRVASTLIEAGFAEDLIYKKSLLGITAMEKEVGKKDFTNLLSSLIIKPAGKPTLVSITDKRPEYNSAEGAKNDFATV